MKALNGWVRRYVASERAVNRWTGNGTGAAANSNGFLGQPEVPAEVSETAAV